MAASHPKSRSSTARVLPSLTHAAWSGVSEPVPTLLDLHQWSCLAFFPCHSRNRARSLRRHYPASSVVRAHPPPCRPALVLAEFRLARVRHRQSFPCCHAFNLADMPAPLPRREQSGASVACFPNRHRPAPYPRRVGSRIACFEACSAFTRVPACLLAEPPKAALWHQGASVYIVTSVNRLGSHQLKRQFVEWGSHPQGIRAFPRRTWGSRLATIVTEDLSRNALAPTTSSAKEKPRRRSAGVQDPISDQISLPDLRRKRQSCCRCFRVRH